MPALAVDAAAGAGPGAEGIRIDGVLAPGEWEGARHITTFVQVQPMTGAPGSLRTEAWLKATPQGLAVAFRNQQPPEVPRTLQRTRRDRMGQLDRVNLMVDFDGDGRTGYDFTLSLAGGIADEVITSERNFNSDWDGHWHHATSQDAQAWYAEILVPWHVAPMARGVGGKRTLGVYLDRVVAHTGERVAWPAASFQRPRFLSDFARIEVPDYEQPLLAVTPYVVAVHDRIAGHSEFDAGADLFWKPNGQFQLAATLNPDFGQVESDDLVVNFSAVESFFGDKRPFFTENQGLFDVPFGSGNSRLLYTRRIGGPADDGSGAGDVAAAIKLNGSLGQVRYGLLVASEKGEAGRDFYALRATRDFGAHDFGAMASHVERPFLDRSATVLSTDHLWTPDDAWTVRSQLVASSVLQAGRRSEDLGFQSRLDWLMGKGWRQQLYLLHLGERLELNDIGYLDRNDFNYLRYELARREDTPPEGSRFASWETRWAASTRRNTSGLRIAEAAAIQRAGELRDGGNEFWEAAMWSAGHDDRLTRGNGVVRVPEKLYLFWERFRPQRGAWSLYGSVRLAGEGLEGAAGLGPELYFEPTLHLGEDLAIEFGLGLQHQPDWLLWRGGDRLGSFRADTARVGASLQWQMGRRQELRVKLETIALDARLRQAWRVAASGEPLPTADPIPDFNLRNLGFQVRWRYELAPLSDLYLVYGRGGLAVEEGSRPLAELLGEATSLRDAEQVLVKLSYRFAN
ncbi:hypothetical protein F0415_04685 [Arenimonas fontis]|uniref:DUF5916 domain-containing protein n=1 Tax=Arenimonas fontis TaxID=2608255 RepID=A0A5B2ZBG8_9GAMM|nr:hypothetical protein F0415_04685 [Arenimonas fontis]